MFALRQPRHHIEARIHFGGDLSKGKLEGKVVTCPRHGSQFDVTTGKRLAGPAKKDLPVYEVKLEGNSIVIGV